LIWRLDWAVWIDHLIIERKTHNTLVLCKAHNTLMLCKAPWPNSRERIRPRCFVKHKSVVCFVLYFPFQVRNDRSKSLNLISISKSISKPNFIFFLKFICYFFLDRGKTDIFWWTRFLDRVIFSSSEKITKNSKKYKIWFPNRFWYKD
jgi:hypothetical protein